MIAEWVSAMPAWVAAHPGLSYVLLFLAAMAESLAIVGLLIPGVLMMFAFGAFIASGALRFWPAFAWAVAGAVAGDGLSFFLGRAFKDRLRGLWPFSRHPEMLQRGIDFFQRHGDKSVLFGRFVGPVRAVVPLVAGMMEMPPGRFLAVNILSALAWAPAYLLPGILFGASLELASEVALRLVSLIVLLLVVTWLVSWLVKRLFRLLQPHAKIWVQRLFLWGRLHPRSGEIASALTDPRHSEGGALAILAAVLILASAGFAVVLGMVLQGTFVHHVDQWTLEALQSLRTPLADHLMVHFSRLADPPVALSFTFGVLAWFVWKQHWRTALYWVAGSLFAFAAPWMIRLFVHIPRPDAGLGRIAGDWSFPSSHTLIATVLFGLLAVIVARPMPAYRRWLPYTAAALLITLVALSRLYLEVCWLSDVLGSVTLGLAWLAVLGIAYARHARPESGWRGVTAVALLVLGFAFGYQTWRHHQEELRAYQPIHLQVAMDAEIWWLSEWRTLPQTRNDLIGGRPHPLDVQYAGRLRELRMQLRRRGWYPAERLDWGNALRLLSPSLPFERLPVLPQVHDGRHEAMILEKRDRGRRMVLRLWASGIRLEAPNTPLWLGNVSYLKRTSLLGLVAFPSTDPDFHTPFQRFLDDLQGLAHWQPTRDRDLVLIRSEPLPE